MIQYIETTPLDFHNYTKQLLQLQSTRADIKKKLINIFKRMRRYE